MKLYVTNILTRRCKCIVEAELWRLGLHGVVGQSGEVRIDNEITAEQRECLKEKLQYFGFELLDARKTDLLEKVIFFVDKRLQESQHGNTKFSAYLEDMLKCEYGYLSNLFSKARNITLEQYIINTKIEIAKELLLYDDLSLTEISYRMEYSSVAHLSYQFKKITGTTPTRFKQKRGKTHKFNRNNAAERLDKMQFLEKLYKSESVSL